MAAPNTEAEAIAMGAKRVDAITQKHIDTFGPAIVNPPDCSQLGPGQKCAEYACVNHTQLVIYCDPDNGCTRYYEVPC
jgi:hypothetical protein